MASLSQTLLSTQPQQADVGKNMKDAIGLGAQLATLQDKVKSQKTDLEKKQQDLTIQKLNTMADLIGKTSKEEDPKMRSVLIDRMGVVGNKLGFPIPDTLLQRFKTSPDMLVKARLILDRPEYQKLVQNDPRAAEQWVRQQLGQEDWTASEVDMLLKQMGAGAAKEAQDFHLDERRARVGERQAGVMERQQDLKEAQAPKELALDDRKVKVQEGQLELNEKLADQDYLLKMLKMGSQKTEDEDKEFRKTALSMKSKMGPQLNDLVDKRTSLREAATQLEEVLEDIKNGKTPSSQQGNMVAMSLVKASTSGAISNQEMGILLNEYGIENLTEEGFRKFIAGGVPETRMQSLAKIIARSNLSLMNEMQARKGEFKGVAESLYPENEKMQERLLKSMGFINMDALSKDQKEAFEQARIMFRPQLGKLFDQNREATADAKYFVQKVGDSIFEPANYEAAVKALATKNDISEDVAKELLDGFRPDASGL